MRLCAPCASWQGPSPLPQRHAEPGPAGGRKPPASARPAPGGYRPAVFRAAPVLVAASRRGGGNAVRFPFPPKRGNPFPRIGRIFPAGRRSDCCFNTLLGQGILQVQKVLRQFLALPGRSCNVNARPHTADQGCKRDPRHVRRRGPLRVPRCGVMNRRVCRGDVGKPLRPCRVVPSLSLVRRMTPYPSATGLMPARPAPGGSSLRMKWVGSLSWRRTVGTISRHAPKSVSGGGQSCLTAW